MEGIMANKQFSNKVKREIEYTITTYLERRLRISCDLLKNDLKDKAVSLDEFVSELQETNRILDNLRRDITRSREKFLYEESINLRRINLVDQISHQVIPSDDNINEMLTLVKYYLNNYSLPNDESFNESLFLRYAMMKLSHDKNDNIKEKALKYFDYLSCNKDICFSECISGRISFGYGSIVLISNQDGKVVFMLDNDKKVSISYSLFDDFILFRDSLYLVQFCDTLIPLREVDGYYHDFLDTGKIYQTSTPSRDDYIEITKSLNEYLEESDILSFSSQIFSIKEMEILTNLINNTDNYRDRESYKKRTITKKNNGN